MKYAIHEDPATHKFVLVRLPDRFVEGDPLTIRPTDRWFDSHAAAVAALPDLLTLEAGDA